MTLVRTLTMSLTVILAAGAGALVAQRGPGGPPPPPNPPVNAPAPPQVPLGTPIQGINAQDLARFNAGKKDFLEVEEEKDGLGPAYNATSCGACHNIGAIGGTGNAAVLRAGTLTNGRFTEPQGGSLIHLFSLPDHQCQPQIPTTANVFTHRIPTPIFGDGLIEAIPDATIQGLANRANQDGVRGRAAMVTDPVSHLTRVGRFGWKAQQATLLAFAGDAYRNEMGITNDIFPEEAGTGLTLQQLAACDKVPGIEDKLDPISQDRGIDRFTNFMRFLAGPVQGPEPSGGNRGENLFDQIGCAVCHVRVLQTGQSANPLFDRKPVVAWSDFLLHDIGTSDGIAQGAANPDEFKTTPLWGMRVRKQLMHDGASLSIRDSIRRHGGESQRSRQRFNNLTQQEQQLVIDFLSVL